MINAMLGRKTISLLYTPFFIFITSIIACIATLMIERYLGIDWDFHPDAVTYINHSEARVKEMMSLGISRVPNNLFFLVVDFFNANINLILTFNILVYASTNVALTNFFTKNRRFLSNQRISSVLLLLVIFNPYRVHLADHILKDTLIIACIVFFTVSSNRLSLFYLIVGALFRASSMLYLIVFVSKKNIIIVSILILMFVSFYWETVYFVITEGNGNMTFREFDKVPSFYEYGVFGSIVRAIVWPFLYLSGFFIFLSPSIMYLPIAVGSFILQFWCVKQYGKLAFYLPVYISMAIFAFIVSGFTSYIRYTLPLITILPILIINKEIRGKSLHNQKDN